MGQISGQEMLKSFLVFDFVKSVLKKPTISMSVEVGNAWISKIAQVAKRTRKNQNHKEHAADLGVASLCLSFILFLLQIFFVGFA